MMSSILKELRKVNMAQAYSFGSSLGEVWEIAIKDSSPLIGSIVSDIKLPQNSKIYTSGPVKERKFSSQHSVGKASAI